MSKPVRFRIRGSGLTRTSPFRVGEDDRSAAMGSGVPTMLPEDDRDELFFQVVVNDAGDVAVHGPDPIKAFVAQGEVVNVDQ